MLITANHVNFLLINFPATTLFPEYILILRQCSSEDENNSVHFIIILTLNKKIIFHQLQTKMKSTEFQENKGM